MLNDYKQLLVFKTLVKSMLIILTILFCVGYAFSQDTTHTTNNGNMVLTTSWDHIKCYKGETEIVSNVSGGQKPFIYTYLTLNGFNNDTLYSGPSNTVIVKEGFYRVRVTDGNGKTVETKVEGATWSWLHIIDGNKQMLPNYEITKPSNKNSNNGKIEILSVQNGESPYNYLWFNGSTENHVKRLVVGSYTVQIIDNNNCIYKDTIILNSYRNSITKVNKVLLEDDTVVIKEQDIQLGQSYPNPIVNPSKIEYLVPMGSDSRINIYDMNGYVIYSFKLNPQTYFIEVYRDMFPVGEFVYTLFVDGVSMETKKFVVFKN